MFLQHVRQTMEAPALNWHLSAIKRLSGMTLNGPLMIYSGPMNDMDFVPVGITQVSAEIARPIMLARSWHSLISATLQHGIRIGLLNCIDRRGEECDHASISA
jgi:hypothetical protein